MKFNEDEEFLKWAPETEAMCGEVAAATVVRPGGRDLKVTVPRAGPECSFPEQSRIFYDSMLYNNMRDSIVSLN